MAAVISYLNVVTKKKNEIKKKREIRDDKAMKCIG